MRTTGDPDQNDVDSLTRKWLAEVFKCPICGAPKTHYRTRGYKCHLEEHNERWQQITHDVIERCSRNPRLDLDSELNAARNQLRQERGGKR